MEMAAHLRSLGRGRGRKKKKKKKMTAHFRLLAVRFVELNCTAPHSSQLLWHGMYIWVLFIIALLSMARIDLILVRTVSLVCDK
jgi:hypothetical protein